MLDDAQTTGQACKRCSTCGEDKILDDFNRKSSRPDGRQEVCRSCNRESMCSTSIIGRAR